MNKIQFFNKKSLAIIIFFYLVSVIFRTQLVKNGNFPFWFDLGRDAILSRQIVEDKDIKIQGPSASGTNDTVFHGVAYYYLIGPAYTIFGGNPQPVLNLLILFSSLSVIPIYLLSKSFSGKDSVAILTLFFFTVSFESFRETTWFSNPIIASVSLPTFFYLFWEVFFNNKKNFLPILALSLAITHQSVILFAPWWGLILIGFLLNYEKNKSTFIFDVKTIFFSSFVYFLGVLSMIITQFKLWQANIFTITSISEFASWAGVEIDRIVSGTQGLFVHKIIESTFPTFPLLAIVLVFQVVIYSKNQFTKYQSIYLLLFLSSPLWLLGWHYRNVDHSLLMLEIPIFIALSSMLVKFWSKKSLRIIVIAVVLLFIKSNGSAISSRMSEKRSKFFVPQGAFFSDLIAAVDYTYEEADGQKFSISTLANPYGYNTLWSYLYSWYGMNKFHYLPSFYGMNQEGMFGENLLETARDPEQIHFSIWEPDKSMPGHLETKFDLEQESVATNSAVKMFGELKVKLHRVQK